MRWRSRSARATREAAGRLASAIEASGAAGRAGFVVALVGPLGAGKTEWVKGLAEGFGIAADDVASPTFVIATEHAGRRTLVHADLYRLESSAELDAAGFGDWLAAGGVVALEWADRFPDALPDDRLEVRIARCADAPEERRIEIDATGPVAKDVLARFAAAGRGEEAESWR